MLGWNLSSGLKHRGWPQKNSTFLKGKSSFARAFVLIWMKQRLMWFNLQRNETRNELSYIKETFTENVLLKMSVLCAKVWAFSKRLVSLKFIGWPGKINVKKKCLMCQIPIRMLKQHATPNSSLHKLKIYSSKGCRKTRQGWIYLAN